jgi:hypothetical protein
MSNPIPKRILIAGGYPHHLPLEVEKAFFQAGWQTAFFDTSPESPWYRPVIKPLRKVIHNLRIKRHPQTLDNTRFSNLGWRSARWVQAIRDSRPDLALVINGNRFGLPWLREAAKVCPLACWMVEPFGRMDKLIEAAQAGVYSRILVYAENYVEELRRHGVESEFYPHHAAETPPESRVCNFERHYDWSFLGGHSPWREECLRSLLAKFPNGFVMGPRWIKVAKRDPVFRSVVHRGYLGKDQSFDLYLDSRIGLDISTSAQTDRNGVTMRAVELLACGCRLLCQPNEEIARLPWDVSPRVLTFSTPMELLSLLTEELSRPHNSSDQVATMKIACQVSGYQTLVATLSEGIC